MAEDTSADRRMLDRMIFFSDAVFAFALLLLAADIRMPDGLDDDTIWRELAQMAPQFASFLISFGLAALWWGVHLSATRELRVFDWPTAICNLLFLVWIVLLPFAADTFAANMMANAPLGLYWCVNAAASATMTLLYIVMTRDKGRLVGGVGVGARFLHVCQALAPGVVFALGAYWAFTGQIWLSRFCAILLAPIMMLLGIISGMLERRRKLKPANA
jgi:uncharacterized membrane protein